MVCGGYLKVSELFGANLQCVVYLATSCAFYINSVTYFLYVMQNERVNRNLCCDEYTCCLFSVRRRIHNYSDFYMSSINTVMAFLVHGEYWAL